MEISVNRVTQWSRVLDAARWTANKVELEFEPSDKFKRNILISQHSPIRLLEWDIKIKGIPYCNAVHFVRHHEGVEKFQATLRDDRNGLIDDRKKLPQDYPVNLWLYCNTEALINISRKRLCSLASKETRDIWRSICQKIREIDPTVEKVLVPECIYRGFCPESKTCGYSQSSVFQARLDAYHNIVIYEEGGR